MDPCLPWPDAVTTGTPSAPQEFRCRSHDVAGRAAPPPCPVQQPTVCSTEATTRLPRCGNSSPLRPPPPAKRNCRARTRPARHSVPLCTPPRSRSAITQSPRHDRDRHPDGKDHRCPRPDGQYRRWRRARHQLLLCTSPAEPGRQRQRQSQRPGQRRVAVGDDDLDDDARLLTATPGPTAPLRSATTARPPTTAPFRRGRLQHPPRVRPGRARHGARRTRPKARRRLLDNPVSTAAHHPVPTAATTPATATNPRRRRPTTPRTRQQKPEKEKDEERRQRQEAREEQQLRRRQEPWEERQGRRERAERSREQAGRRREGREQEEDGCLKVRDHPRRRTDPFRSGARQAGRGPMSVWHTWPVSSTSPLSRSSPTI